MRILGAGDNVVDRYPDLGLLYPGGNCVNVAVSARRSGAEAAYLGVLGDDEAGRVVLASLKTEGLDTTRVRVAHGPNAWADVHLESGDRVFGDYFHGVSPFRLSAADLDYAATFDIVHLCAGGFLEDDLPALTANAPISFDFKAHTDPEFVDPILAGTAYAFFSASEVEELAVVALLEHAAASGALVAVATRGARDVLALTGGKLYRQSATVAEPIDTLGAGDSFIGRFLVGQLGGEELSTTLRAAADAAATTCRAYGAFGHAHPYSPEDRPGPFAITGRGESIRAAGLVPKWDKEETRR